MAMSGLVRGPHSPHRTGQLRRQKHPVVWMWSEPVISPSSAQPGLKISREWADGSCATVSVTRMEMAGPCQSAWDSASSSALHQHGVLGSVLGLGNPHTVCQGQCLAQSILAVTVAARRHRQLQRDRPFWVHRTEQGTALNP